MKEEPLVDPLGAIPVEDHGVMSSHTKSEVLRVNGDVSHDTSAGEYLISYVMFSDD